MADINEKDDCYLADNNRLDTSFINAHKQISLYPVYHQSKPYSSTRLHQKTGDESMENEKEILKMPLDEMDIFFEALKFPYNRYISKHLVSIEFINISVFNTNFSNEWDKAFSVSVNIEIIPPPNKHCANH